MKFKINDVVQVKNANKVSQIVKISHYETHELIGEEVRITVENYYTLGIDNRSYKEKQLEIVEVNKETLDDFDKLIVDIALKERNFEYLKQYLAEKDVD